ncbi:hypothetical protein OK016_13315 [Vibrio chagasii]|nr:hypothetical protein [Vibrio chagasii]
MLSRLKWWCLNLLRWRKSTTLYKQLNEWAMLVVTQWAAANFGVQTAQLGEW